MGKLVLAPLFFPAFIFLAGCSDPFMREAFFRGMASAYYQRSQNPYVHPLGRASESFAASFFGTLADSARQERLTEQWQGSYQAQLAVPTYSREQVFKMRTEAEAFLRADKDSFDQWTTFLPQWAALLASYGPQVQASPHYLLSKKLYDDTATLDSRAKFYLANLPAYIHENMDAEKLKTEIQDYLSKRDGVVKMQKEWTDQVTPLLEAARKRDEEIKRIEAERNKF